MNARSLTFRLVAWYCGALLVVGGFYAVYSYVGFGNYLQAVMRDTLATRAQEAADLARPYVDQPEALGLAIRSRFESAAHDRYMRLSVDDQTLYLSESPIERAFDPKRLAVSPNPVEGLKSFGSVWVFSRIEQLPDHRKFVVEAGQLDNLPSAAKRGLVATLLTALPILLAIAAYGGYRLVRQALAPVASMINAAEALTFNSPSKRLPSPQTDDVIDELSRTMNRMLERLDSAYQHAHKFSGDAAHELRTPLAIMRGELEFVAAHQDLSAENSLAVENALNESIRLGQIVENLLALNLIDSVGGKRAHVAVELHALATDTIDQMRLLADEKQIVLTCPKGPAVVTLADRNRLKQVLVNLIDNAIKYTEPSGRVAVVVRVQGDNAVVEVMDTGVGIAPEHQQHVFDRFYRVYPDRGATGAGLGLAISKSICIAHGGTLELDSGAGRGSTFRVSLPLAPSATET